MFLDDFHDVIQAAFGWTDTHLHRFGCGPQYYSHDTEYYLCPWLLAGKTPPRCTDACQTQAGLIMLIATAAQVTGDLNAIVADLLGAIGWTSGEGTPLTSLMAGHAAWNTATVLRRVGAFTDERDCDRRERPTLDGVSFARAALTSWPTS